MEIGFSSTTFTGTETDGYARVCVELTNPPFGGAVAPLHVTMLPEDGNTTFSTYDIALLLYTNATIY